MDGFKFGLEYVRPYLQFKKKKNKKNKKHFSSMGPNDREQKRPAGEQSLGHSNLQPRRCKRKTEQRLKRQQGPKGQQTGRRQVILELCTRAKEARYRVTIQPHSTGCACHFLSDFQRLFVDHTGIKSKPSERETLQASMSAWGSCYPPLLLSTPPLTSGPGRH